MADPVPPNAVTTRLTTAERDATVARLSSAFAHDVIELDEFERRTTLALRAASSAELAALVADLPTETTSGSSTRSAVASPAVANAAVATMPYRLDAVLSNVERRGPIEVPARLEIRAIAGNVELDLSAARFTAEVTQISIRAVCGNVELWLPAGAVVENRGGSILGSFRHQAAPVLSAAAPPPPVRIVVTGRAILGNVEVEIVPVEGRPLLRGQSYTA